MTQEPTVSKLPTVPPWIIAVAAALLFGGLDVAAALAGRISLHNPLGLAAVALTGDWRGDISPSHVPLAFQLFVAAKAAGCALFALLPGAACLARTPRRRLVLLGLLVACAVLLDSIALHVLVAAHLGLLLPWRHGLWMLLAQYLAGVAVDTLLVLDLGVRLGEAPRWSLLAYVSAERTIAAAGYLAARLVLREHRMRRALATAHAQMLATRSLLAETVRGAERLRIARDLHDAVGHHLTALNLHLDLALRQSREAAPPALITARDAGGQLLAQVRNVVSGSRQDQDIDLEQAIRLLCDGIPGLAIGLHVDPAAARHPAPVAHALFCCIQEAVTNALRHAHARRLDIALALQDGATVVRVADDGHGNAALAEGNGLRGMRERLADLGGELHYGARAGGGFALELRLPPREVAA
ncbi:histidine kinase [Massilia sp. IC2-477]|uniref:sensor histidine kinase n=1 Tax=Massilia sp. IC2-477 TaxID=2887198 RepID=UPI001D107753|nr:histidine kinase [Massilia sp. IC2-477]MCC2954216.1 histidine kinase [Massilia sp. IC2-477]